jgi:hypothetical protein
LTPFLYTDFYDVPRNIILVVGKKWILLQSAFDEGMDEYEPDYSVYRLPSSFEPPPKGTSWEFLKQDLEYLGKIPVREVEFDETKRRTLNAAALDELVAG